MDSVNNNVSLLVHQLGQTLLTNTKKRLTIGKPSVGYIGTLYNVNNFSVNTKPF